MKKTVGVILLGVVLLLIPLVAKSPYYMHLIIVVCMNIILGMTFSMIYSVGLITLGAAGFWAIGAYASALLVIELKMPFWMALPVSGGIAAIIGLFFGYVMVRRPGVAFIVLTFVLNLSILQAAGQIHFFGGWAGITDIPRPGGLAIPFFRTFDFNSKPMYYYLILTLLVITVVVFYSVYDSRVGRAMKAIKLNPRLAETLGISLFRYRLFVFVLACFFAGLAGSFWGHYNQSLEPLTFSIFKSLYIQLYSIVGGLEFYILGPIVGACIMTLVPEALRIAVEFEPIVFGIMLLAIVVFMRGGVLGVVTRILGNRIGRAKQLEG
jgi:branched-chain amino acid transport system permease protein